MIKPTMSHCVDQNHLNEKLVKYYEQKISDITDSIRDCFGAHVIASDNTLRVNKEKYNRLVDVVNNN